MNDALMPPYSPDGHRGEGDAGEPAGEHGPKQEGSGQPAVGGVDAGGDGHEPQQSDEGEHEGIERKRHCVAPDRFSLPGGQHAGHRVWVDEQRHR